MTSSSCVLSVKNTTAEIASSSSVLLVTTLLQRKYTHLVLYWWKHCSRDSILIMCPIGDDTAALVACSSHVLTASSYQCSNVHLWMITPLFFFILLNPPINCTVFFFICLSSSNKLHSLSDLQRTLLAPCKGMPPVAFLCTSHSQSHSNNSKSLQIHSSEWNYSCSK
jgi:hypothetical protein